MINYNSTRRYHRFVYNKEYADLLEKRNSIWKNV
jgi:hypothetical protein